MSKNKKRVGYHSHDTTKGRYSLKQSLYTLLTPLGKTKDAGWYIDLSIIIIIF
ncbi:hypothetical protein CALK_1984 [Chitinivibrio alkaliphilus ACht1]|uniref:Uncharacterized protein n=1 Tax=Chitinivibrio alkaliphilus ACht1 TaxID=1313304 RepID=U7D3M3_9BACT|nr:hypothetical protein CALK_1984 [Chitinivibrio alkaliphilus ACht1]